MTDPQSPAPTPALGRPATPAPWQRIVILGGGFGGLFTARHLESALKDRPGAEITVVCRDNFFLMTPLLFEACSGILELRNCSVPIRAFLRHARFVEAEVTSIDLDRRTVHARAPEGPPYELPYDQLVLALGSTTNLKMIPGSEHAFTFKSLADAVVLRNHLIERFERAAVETDAAHKRRLLTFAVIGGGLVGVELFGEITAFVDEIARLYKGVERDEVRFYLLEAGERLMPELDPKLGDYAGSILGKRKGAAIRLGAKVKSIEPEAIVLEHETIHASTIVLAAGIAPSPVVAALPVDRDRKGRIAVDGTMRSKSRPEVWALGDCASIPDPEGKPYPALAQHALRQAKVLAGNIHGAFTGVAPQPFVYKTLGLMAALGHNKGLAQILGFRVTGFPAWFAWRTYYLLQLPGWGRRLRVAVDWTVSLVLRPDIVKVDMGSDRPSRRPSGPAGMIAEAERRAPQG